MNNKFRAEPLEVSLSVFSHSEGGNTVLPLCFVVLLPASSVRPMLMAPSTDAPRRVRIEANVEVLESRRLVARERIGHAAHASVAHAIALQTQAPQTGMRGHGSHQRFDASAIHVAVVEREVGESAITRERRAKERELRRAELHVHRGLVAGIEDANPRVQVRCCRHIVLLLYGTYYDRKRRLQGQSGRLIDACSATACEGQPAADGKPVSAAVLSSRSARGDGGTTGSECRAAVLQCES